MLFSSIEEVKQFVAVNLTSQFSTISPYIEEAEETYLVPVIGEAMYGVMNAYAAADPQSDAKKSKLLKFLRRAVINYAYFIYAPTGNVLISDGGFHISVNENKKAAFQWQVDEVKASWLKTAHKYLDLSVAYLDKEADTFTEWKTSAEFKAAKRLLVNTAADFNAHFWIGNSRRLFVIMAPIQQSIEPKYVKHTISAALLAELKTQIQAANVNEKNQALLDLLTPAVVHLTMARALVELPIEILPEGVFDNSTSFTQTKNVRTSSAMERIQILRQVLQDDGRAELKAVQEFLDTHADDYPLYKESSCYVIPSDTPRDEIANSAEDKIVIF